MLYVTVHSDIHSNVMTNTHHLTVQSDIHNTVMKITHQFTFNAVGIFTKFNKSATDFTSI